MEIGSANWFTSVAQTSKMQAKFPDLTVSTGKTSQLTEGTAKQEFLDWAEMSPGERTYASIVRSLGYSEDDINSMSAEDRSALEEKIKEMIREQAEKSGESGQIYNRLA